MKFKNVFVLFLMLMFITPTIISTFDHFFGDNVLIENIEEKNETSKDDLIDLDNFVVAYHSYNFYSMNSNSIKNFSKLTTCSNYSSVIVPPPEHFIYS